MSSELVLESPWRTPDETHPDAMSLHGFCKEYGLIPEFLPFDYIQRDPIEDMCTIQYFLDGRPDTRQIVSTLHISEENDIQLNHYPETKQFLDSVSLLLGWWDTGYSTSYGRYYANPNYHHSNERYHVQPEDHQEFFKHAARLGIDYSTIAPAIGVDVEDNPRLRKDCSEMAHAAGVSYKERKREGFYNLIRTWKTINHWGYTYREISNAFGTPIGTVTGRVIDIAGDFEPPDEPSKRRIK